MRQVLILLFLVPTFIFGQDCNCVSNFGWLKTTFEENDAGFQYIIDSKGEEAYEVHSQMVRSKLKTALTPGECSILLNEWLSFFRKGHIGLSYIGQSANEPTSNEPKADEDKKEQRMEVWESYSIGTKKFKEYLNQKTTQDFEGIYGSGPYKIGIKREENVFIGFIIESGNEVWSRGEIKLKIFDQDGKVSSVYYMGDRSAVESEDVLLLGTNNLQVGNIYFTRTYPEIKDDSPYRLHFKMLNSQLPFLEQLNESTLYFRIPSFTGTPEKLAIDSVIAANREKLLTTENLIIDIRNGTGGSDFGYKGIIPFFYTNPIRTPGVKFRSTILNNQRMLDFSNSEGLAIEYNLQFTEEEKKGFKRDYEKLSKHIGEFVNVDSATVSITKHDSIYPFPKKVGIIHNQRNASTDEQFLLAAKQSKKVKLFGRTTAGALDVSNLNVVKSPCEDYRLFYTLTKSLRIPHMSIDDKGIQPDYFIDNEIPEYEWINYVSKILNE